jgi:autotransporter-associated beta strand protein
VNFSNLAVTNAVTGLPNAGLAPTTFSVRWLGQVLTPNSSGSYTFVTTTDDGARLWVNGTLIVDSWIDQGATARSGTITLSANTLYDIVMEFYQNGSAASAVLSWSPPGSGTTNAIPSSNLLLPGAGALVKTGGGTLTLSGANTYTGPTVVGAGTLEISSANGLASTSVTVTNSGTLKLDSASALNSQTSLILNTNTGSPTVNLNFSGTASLGQLSLDGGATTAASGTWGSPASGAQHTSSRFTGIGLLSPGVCSSTNVIVGVTNAGNRTLTLTMRGSVGAQYYLLTHTNILQPFTTWQPVTGSTNVVSAGNGLWSLSISNPAPTGFYRVKAIQPCP